MKKENLLITVILFLVIGAIAAYFFITKKTATATGSTGAGSATDTSNDTVWVAYEVVGEDTTDVTKTQIYAAEANQIRVNLTANDINEGDFYAHNPLAVFRGFQANDIIELPYYVMS